MTLAGYCFFAASVLDIADSALSIMVTQLEGKRLRFFRGAYMTAKDSETTDVSESVKISFILGLFAYNPSGRQVNRFLPGRLRP